MNNGCDFYCAYRDVWVSESEFNGDKPEYYHEPRNGAPYVAKSHGACKCLKCPVTDRALCGKCDNPKFLHEEQAEKVRNNSDVSGNVILSKLANIRSRCSGCIVQYRKNGILR